MKAFLFLFSVLTLQFFHLSPFLIDGPSMEPMLQSGDVIMIDENASGGGRLERGDVVVFSFEDEPGYYYVKRIIGMPGETIHIKEDGIYLGGTGESEQKLDESYLLDGTSSVLITEAYRANYEHTYVIPQDKYFVMGDNRAHSMDSRYFKNPFIKQSDLKGKYLFNLTDL